jgi:hypothetical protein
VNNIYLMLREKTNFSPELIPLLKQLVLESYSDRQKRTDPNYDVVRGRLSDPRVVLFVLTALDELSHVAGLLTAVKAHVYYGTAMPDEYESHMGNVVPDEIMARFQEPGIAALVHAVLGVGSESAELCQSVEKYLINTDQVLDKTNVAVELGDISWFLRAGLAAINVSLYTCLEQNHAKLLKRFPDKFDEKAAVERDVAAERAVEERFVANQADGTGDPGGE